MHARSLFMQSETKRELNSEYGFIKKKKLKHKTASPDTKEHMHNYTHCVLNVGVHARDGELSCRNNGSPTNFSYTEKKL